MALRGRTGRREPRSRRRAEAAGSGENRRSGEADEAGGAGPGGGADGPDRPEDREADDREPGSRGRFRGAAEAARQGFGARTQRARVRLQEAAARMADARRTAGEPVEPKAHLSLVRAPSRPVLPPAAPSELTVATYNVHRWTGLNGRKAPNPARAGFVISELDADVIALQEVLRPAVSAGGDEGEGDDPLVDLSEALGMHLVFAVTREHRRGELGNAILSRYPVAASSVLDISHSRIERRGALAAQFDVGQGLLLGVVATHLSLVDRTRNRQVRSLLEHALLNAGPAILAGDMNAWRRCRGTRQLEANLISDHHNLDWPASFPSAAPVLSLDRVYARGARVVELRTHDTPASRRASDHLPVVARVAFEAT